MVLSAGRSRIGYPGDKSLLCGERKSAGSAAPEFTGTYKTALRPGAANFRFKRKFTKLPLLNFQRPAVAKSILNRGAKDGSY